MERKWYRFIFAEDSDDLTGGAEKTLFLIWNVAAFLLSSAALCAVSLNFAIGDMPLYYIYLGYFKSPLIFLLNWLPILFLQILLFALMRRQWLAFLMCSVLTLLPAFGNYFKLKFRADPFTFEDISSISAGLKVAGDYQIAPNIRIWLAIACALVGTGILFFFARGKLCGRMRLVSALLVLCMIWPLWTKVYSDGDLYYRNYMSNYMWLAKDDRDSFIATGFPYPFLHSITRSANTQPENYSEKETEALFQSYQSEPIPENRKVNILAIQLESFCDMEAAGVAGIRPDLYAPLRTLQAESCSGTMIANVIGGGTINTERAFVTGGYRQMDYHRAAFSYVRYLTGQGYHCYATHPNAGHFYTRRVTDLDLGFEEFYGLDDYFQEITGGEIQCDATYLPEVFRMFRERIAEGNGPIFAFNVSWQGHGPYSEETLEYSDGSDWSQEDASEEAFHAFNNYLGLIAETQQIILEEVRDVEDASEPIVIIIFGDHKPLFSEYIYRELGIINDLESEQEMKNFLGTPYLIWANNAAKALLGDKFQGEAPMLSPCFMMVELFDRLSWAGPAYMQFTREVMQHIPVLCTRGVYVENGQFTRELSEQGNELVDCYADLQYYLRYRPELSE